MEYYWIYFPSFLVRVKWAKQTIKNHFSFSLLNQHTIVKIIWWQGHSSYLDESLKQKYANILDAVQEVSIMEEINLVPLRKGTTITKP